MAKRPKGILEVPALKTGIHPNAIPTVARSLTTGERVDLWFIKPLKRMKNDDGFVALMICLPLIEKIVRYRTGTLDEEDLKLSEGSKPLKALAKFLQISEANAEIFWEQFRHGLLHRAMVKPAAPYQLDPDHEGPPVFFTADGAVLVNIWRLRDKVIKEFEVIVSPDI